MSIANTVLLLLEEEQMINQRYYSRQINLIDPDRLDFPILIVGAGVVGSWTALALTKLGCRNLTLVDDQKVEPPNVGCQIYRPLDIGKLKVVALREHLTAAVAGNAEFEGESILVTIFDMKVEKLLGLGSSLLIINAADSMDTRRYLFEHLQKNQTLIDGRMAGNAIEIYTTCGEPQKVEQKEYYKNTLFDGKKAQPIPCGEKSVAYNGFVIAGLIADLVSKFANKEALPLEVIVDLKNLQMFKST